MSFQTTLSLAIHTAHTISVDDFFVQVTDDTQRKAFQGAPLVVLNLEDGTEVRFEDQTIEVDDLGTAYVKDLSGEERMIDLRMSKPMTAADLVGI